MLIGCYVLTTTGFRITTEGNTRQIASLINTYLMQPVPPIAESCIISYGTIYFLLLILVAVDKVVVENSNNCELACNNLSLLYLLTIASPSEQASDAL